MKEYLDATGLAELCSNIKTYFVSLLANYAPKASPTFTGTPTAPTAASGTNTTQLATTAFVQDAVGNATSVVINDDETMPASVPNEGLWFQLTGDTSITNGENIGY